jgi:hypothetical protein
MPAAKSKSKSKSKTSSKPKRSPTPVKKLTSVFKDRMLGKAKAAPKPAKPIPTNHVAFVIDRSGSMDNLRTAVVETFNSNLAAIKQEVYKNTTADGKSDQKTTFTRVVFSDYITMPVKAQPIESVKSMRADDYYPNGGTALLQAVGETIETLEALPRTTRFPRATSRSGKRPNKEPARPDARSLEAFLPTTRAERQASIRSKNSSRRTFRRSPRKTFRSSMTSQETPRFTRSKQRSR